MQDVNLRLLRVFLAVAEAGGFSRAASSLSVAQPILSRQIKALESELGIQLFYRNGRGVVLTKAGEVFEVHARNVLKGMDQAIADLSQLAGSPAGEVVLGLPPTVGYVLSSELIKRFRAEFPKIQLCVTEGFSGHVLEWLAAGKLDVAVLYATSKTAVLNVDELLDEELVLVGPPGDPVRLGDGPVLSGSVATRAPLIVPSRSHGLRILLDQQFQARGLTLNVIVEIDSLTTILDLVESGVGYTYLPFMAVRAFVQAGRMKVWRIEDPHLSRTLILTTSTSRPMTTATRALATFVRGTVSALVKEGAWSPPA